MKRMCTYYTFRPYLWSSSHSKHLDKQRSSSRRFKWQNSNYWRRKREREEAVKCLDRAPHVDLKVTTSWLASNLVTGCCMALLNLWTASHLSESFRLFRQYRNKHELHIVRNFMAINRPQVCSVLHDPHPVLLNMQSYRKWYSRPLINITLPATDLAIPWNTIS
jgi:hypothetical protein